jgi:sugar phosphate isomerase/epimerase
MGIAVTSYLSFGRPKDTYEFLEHASALGAGGIQMPLTSRERDYIRKLRARADELGMYFEAIASLPGKDGTAVFESTVAAAKEAGALAIRVNCLPGRRYENFTNLPDWQKAVAQSHLNIDAALRIVESHQVPLAIENHKDWTADEMAALMKAKASRWLGVCLDTGNNIALRRIQPYKGYGSGGVPGRISAVGDAAGRRHAGHAPDCGHHSPCTT